MNGSAEAAYPPPSPDRTGVPSLMRRLSDLGIGFKDLSTRQSSLEDIFVGLVHQDREVA